MKSKMKPHFKALLSGFTRELLRQGFPSVQKDMAEIQEKLFAVTSERFWKNIWLEELRKGII